MLSGDPAFRIALSTPNAACSHAWTYPPVAHFSPVHTLGCVSNAPLAHMYCVLVNGPDCHTRAHMCFMRAWQAMNTGPALVCSSLGLANDTIKDLHRP